MSKIVALIMALTSVGAPATSSASVNCRTVPTVITRGICTRHFGVGYHVVTVAVPCRATCPAARTTREPSDIGSAVMVLKTVSSTGCYGLRSPDGGYITGINAYGAGRLGGLGRCRRS